MIKLLFLAVIISLITLISPPTVIAWDDHETENSCMSCVCGDGYKGERWPISISGSNNGITFMDAPPQLTVSQAFRWRTASALSRSNLAKLYSISIEIAEQYGAIYPKYKKWIYSNIYLDAVSGNY